MGRELQVKEALDMIREVKESYRVYGIYDVIARVEAKDVEELKDIVFPKIRLIPGVRSTMSLIEM
jgi:DNA-binding Lrp family transcriptional regulator